MPPLSIESEIRQAVLPCPRARQATWCRTWFPRMQVMSEDFSTETMTYYGLSGIQLYFYSFELRGDCVFFHSYGCTCAW